MVPVVYSKDTFIVHPYVPSFLYFNSTYRNRSVESQNTMIPSRCAVYWHLKTAMTKNACQHTAATISFYHKLISQCSIFFAGGFYHCETMSVCGHVCITPYAFVIFAHVRARFPAPIIMEWQWCGSKMAGFSIWTPGWGWNEAGGIRQYERGGAGEGEGSAHG